MEWYKKTTLYKTTYKFAEKEASHSQLPGRRDGPADAYKHTLAAAEAVRQGYPEWAVRLWGSFQEWDNPPDRAAMDKHNNDVGFAIGREATSREDLLRRVREAINKGGSTNDKGGSAKPEDLRPNWFEEEKWGGNPKNDETKHDKNDRWPTDKTNWPARWPKNGGLSPEDPTWWREEQPSDDGTASGSKGSDDDDSSGGSSCNTSNPLGDFQNPDGNGNGVPDFMDPQCGGLGGGAGDTANEGNGGAGSAIPRDPLVLDLDGDGVDLTDLEGSNAYFDLNGDGFATRTSWLSGDDGFLVLDRNSDGTINDITELFGSPERTGIYFS